MPDDTMFTPAREASRRPHKELTRQVPLGGEMEWQRNLHWQRAFFSSAELISVLLSRSASPQDSVSGTSWAVQRV